MKMRTLLKEAQADLDKDIKDCAKTKLKGRLLEIKSAEIVLRRMKEQLKAELDRDVSESVFDG